jgi:transcriptional regulator of arginine metabolism
MNKKRHDAILQLVRSQSIYTQAELIARLAQLGIVVTQATISRDIRQLGLLKEPTARGQRYAAPDRGDAAGGPHARAFRDGVTNVAHAGNTLVLSTHTGMAASVGVAFDAMHFPHVLGSVAGDNCIIAIMRDEAAAASLAAQLA